MTKIYLQINKVEEWGFSINSSDDTLSSTSLWVFTNKFWIKNPDNWGLVFCVASGTYQQYKDCLDYQSRQVLKLPSPLDNNKRIYYLWFKFVIERVTQDSDGMFEVEGKKRAKSFSQPVLLHESITPGFNDFKKSYMTSGLINLAKSWHPYLDTLLEITGEDSNFKDRKYSSTDLTKKSWKE